MCGFLLRASAFSDEDSQFLCFLDAGFDPFDFPAGFTPSFDGLVPRLDLAAALDFFAAALLADLPSRLGGSLQAGVDRLTSDKDSLAGNGSSSA